LQYDIRIWPNIYKALLEEADKQNQDDSSEPKEHKKKSFHYKRAIKRRYREFMELHSRLTNGPLAIYMKGMLVIVKSNERKSKRKLKYIFAFGSPTNGIYDIFLLCFLGKHYCTPNAFVDYLFTITINQPINQSFYLSTGLGVLSTIVHKAANIPYKRKIDIYSYM